MRKEMAVDDVDARCVASGEECRHEVAGSVIGGRGGRGIRTQVEAARDVREVVLDVLDAETTLARIEPASFRDLRPQVAEARRSLPERPGRAQHLRRVASAYRAFAHALARGSWPTATISTSAMPTFAVRSASTMTRAGNPAGCLYRGPSRPRGPRRRSGRRAARRPTHRSPGPPAWRKRWTHHAPGCEFAWRTLVRPAILVAVQDGTTSRAAPPPAAERWPVL